jgi:hypothetical protein
VKLDRETLAALERAFAIGWKIGADERHRVTKARRKQAWVMFLAKLGGEELSTNSVDRSVQNLQDRLAVRHLAGVRKNLSPPMGAGELRTGSAGRGTTLGDP